ncbi:MAG: hypothetical protein LBL07_17795 [Tannerella sp.]|jgi:hypothetical protein|nr:hypothetical protein [Tannerella sp.]
MQHNEIIYNSAALSGDPSGTMPFHIREIPGALFTAVDFIKIWSSGNDLYIRTSKPGSIARIYTPKGILHKLQTALTTGETRIKLPQGIYIVTLNSSPGQKVMIE